MQIHVKYKETLEHIIDEATWPGIADEISSRLETLSVFNSGVSIQHTRLSYQNIKSSSDRVFKLPAVITRDNFRDIFCPYVHIGDNLSLTLLEGHSAYVQLSNEVLARKYWREHIVTTLASMLVRRIDNEISRLAQSCYNSVYVLEHLRDGDIKKALSIIHAESLAYSGEEKDVALLVVEDRCFECDLLGIENYLFSKRLTVDNELKTHNIAVKAFTPDSHFPDIGFEHGLLIGNNALQAVSIDLSNSDSKTPFGCNSSEHSKFALQTYTQEVDGITSFCCALVHGYEIKDQSLISAIHINRIKHIPNYLTSGTRNIMFKDYSNGKIKGEIQL